MNTYSYIIVNQEIIKSELLILKNLPITLYLSQGFAQI